LWGEFANRIRRRVPCRGDKWHLDEIVITIAGEKHWIWTTGKNFDAIGAFGPWLVTPDAVPPGAQGLRIQGRLNGRVTQDARTDLLIEMISVAISLEPGDVIITGTPGGVGAARKPPVFMQPGDVFEVEIEGIGVLSNPIQDE
jgi:2-keto-4-pentenoate hydratase/2-oxohepta-3-ene-1,7-dioic acid hydratase in catechol pathway